MPETICQIFEVVEVAAVEATSHFITTAEAAESHIGRNLEARDQFRIQSIAPSSASWVISQIIGKQSLNLQEG